MLFPEFMVILSGEEEGEMSLFMSSRLQVTAYHNMMQKEIWVKQCQLGIPVQPLSDLRKFTLLL